MSKKNNEIKLVNNVVSSNKKVDNNKMLESIVEGIASSANAILKIHQLPIATNLKAAVMFETVNSVIIAANKYYDYLEAQMANKHENF